MKRIFVVVALVSTLLVPATSVGAWDWGQQSTPSVTSSYEMKVLDWISDNVALTKIPLRPWTKAFLNRIIRFIGPALCPILGSFAAADFQALVVDMCNQVVASPDPLGTMTQALPLLCTPGMGEMVFPDFAAVLPIVCGILV